MLHMWNVSSWWSSGRYRRRDHDQPTSSPAANAQRIGYGSVARCEACAPALARWMKRLEDATSGLSPRAEVLPVRRHVATTLDDLPDQLILRQPHGDSVERRAALPTRLVERMTVPALLRLEDEARRAVRARCVPRGISAEPACRSTRPSRGSRALCAPRLVSDPHATATRRMVRTAIGRRLQLFSPSPAKNGNAMRKRDADGRRDQQNGVSAAGRQIREHRVDTEEESLVSAAVWMIVGSGRPPGPNGPRNAAHAAIESSTTPEKMMSFPMAPGRTESRRA